MEYNEIKNHLIDEIYKLCQNLDANTLESIIGIAKEEQPICLDTYISVEFSEYPKEIREELSHEIRKIWLKTSPGCTEPGYLLKTQEYVDEWHDIEIDGLMFDTWIAEQDPLFNPVTLAQIIFEIYCGRITFRK